MSARRQKAWSQHATPRGSVDQGRTARLAQVEAALAETKLFKAAKRLSSAAQLLSAVIPCRQINVNIGGKTIPFGTTHRFPVMGCLLDQITTRAYLRERRAPLTVFEAFWNDLRPVPKLPFDDWVAEVENKLREAMAWACANVPPMEMLRFAASWPHGAWLPVSGEAQL